jgi:uncharacterized spore protein YtfJ
MCLICVEFQKERMTVLEARRAFREMVVDMTPQHAREVRDMLDQAKQPAPQTSAQGQPKDD